MLPRNYACEAGMRGSGEKVWGGGLDSLGVKNKRSKTVNETPKR